MTSISSGIPSSQSRRSRLCLPALAMSKALQLSHRWITTMFENVIILHKESQILWICSETLYSFFFPSKHLLASTICGLWDLKQIFRMGRPGKVLSHLHWDPRLIRQYPVWRMKSTVHRTLDDVWNSLAKGCPYSVTVRNVTSNLTGYGNSTIDRMQSSRTDDTVSASSSVDHTFFCSGRIVLLQTE